MSCMFIFSGGNSVPQREGHRAPRHKAGQYSAVQGRGRTVSVLICNVPSFLMCMKLTFIITVT